MAAEDTELEEILTEAGNALFSPSSSVEQLLFLLERLEGCLLSMKQQYPCGSMQRALEIAMKALVHKELLDNKDADVRVYVASCLIQVNRITAPDAPYDDTTMEEILRLIVAAFDNLSDISHCLYLRRVSILRCFAKIRLFLVMADLKCYDLIVDMFKHFFNNIREHHPDFVYSSMGFVMILVVEESDEITLELVSTLLEFVRKENKKVLPKAWKLAKRVIHNCSSKLAPYMSQAVKDKGFPLEDYSKLVAFIYQHSDVRPDGLEGCEEDDSTRLEEAISGFFEAATPDNYVFPRAITLGGENHSAKPDSSNMVPQESKRNSRKNLKEVSSSKTNVDHTSSAASRYELHGSRNQESATECNFIDDSASSSI